MYGETTTELHNWEDFASKWGTVITQEYKPYSKTIAPIQL